MKKTFLNITWLIVLKTAVLLILSSCSRSVDSLDQPSNSTNPDVFINTFSAGLEYAAFGGSVPEAFQIDEDVTYGNTSTASMRFEVPDVGDPRGAYAGGTFFTTSPRNLSGYNALTFWAKASQPVSVDVMGIGNDLGENKYLASLSGVNLNTNWKKVIIPIPNPEKLTAARGMFFYSAGAIEERGYTFWVDQVRYEDLGTIAHAEYTFFDGEDLIETSFIGISRPLSGVSSKFNLPTGVDLMVETSPAYFDFVSSDPSVATVDDAGNISTIGGPGNTQITARVGGKTASGSLRLQSLGQFEIPPTPAQNPADVISIFSNVYDNVPVDYYNGFWEPFQTTLSADFTIDGDDFLYYTNFNFVGIQFTSPTVDASNMTNLRADIYIPADLSNDAQFAIEIVDFGADVTGRYSTTITPDQSRQWISLDIPLSDFAGLTSRSALAQIIFIDDNDNIPGFFADNIFFYSDDGTTPPPPGDEPGSPAPAPVQSAENVISLFSDAYDDVSVDTWRTEWSAAEFEDIMIQGNPTKKYSALDFVGIETVANQIDITEMTHFHMDVWSPDFTSFGVKLVDFGPDGMFNGGDDTEDQIDFVGLPQGEWVRLEIPLDDFAELTTRENIAQLILVGEPTGETTVFVDNVFFYKEDDTTPPPPGDEPAEAAPAPVQDAADVISLFSRAYDDVPVDTWRTEWSAADYEEIAIDGNPTKRYSSLDFVGIETVANQIDITEMTHFHMDVWSVDFDVFRVKLVDFGPDGEFNGGDDTEHEIVFENLPRGEWVRLEIPLSDFEDLTTRENIAQLILSGLPTGAFTVYVDNIFFYKE